MKRLILILLLGFSFPCFSQGPYKSLEECKNDTLEYIAYNFERNQARYIGKTMKFLLDEIDIPLMTQYLYLGDAGPYFDYKVDCISLDYFPPMSDYRPFNKIIYSVLICFDMSTLSWTSDDFYERYADEECDLYWSDGLYEMLKDYKIEKIYVRKYPRDQTD